MASDTGYSGFYKIKKETTWGTAVTPDTDIGLLDATGSINEPQNVTENYGTGTRLNQQLTYGKYGVSGSLSGKIQNGALIAYAIGADSPSGTGPTTHTISQYDNTSLNSFTLSQNMISNDKGFKAAGCKINDFSLTLETDGILSGTFNWIGKDVTTISSTVGTRSVYSNTVLPSYTGAISWNSSEIECKTFNLNYNNNLGDDEYSVGDRRRQAITQGAVSINGNMGVIFSGLTEYGDFKTAFSTGVEIGTKRALSLVATTGATSSLYELSFGLTNVALSETTRAIELSNNRIVAEFNWIATSMGTVTYKDQTSGNYIA